MAIDLLSEIRDDKAIKVGGFTGAIFLTYSLNLTFFEQIVVPALEQSGCSDLLILCDMDGYHQALELGAKSVHGAGLRYVCAPVLRKGWGIQHAKTLLMVGPNYGRIFVGSGNLTLHGYGRNLELYSHFEYDRADVSADASPLLEVWKLIELIVSDSKMPVAVMQQIKTIQEKVPWLKDSPGAAESVIWHNYHRPILEQLDNWRKAHGYHEPAERIKAISPYYDEHLSAVKQIVSNTATTQLQIYFDPGLTNLEGEKAAKAWQTKKPKLNTFGIGPSEQQDSLRHVHAKALIGQEKKGSWCITGSANLSRPALLTSWLSGGNLEIVTFH